MEKSSVRAQSPNGSFLESENNVAIVSRRSSLSHHSASVRNWELVRQAFLDDKLPVPILMVENAFMVNETSSSWGLNRDVGELSYSCAKR